MKRGSLDFYFVGIVLIFILGASVLIMTILDEYRQEQGGEGIGFRQATLMESYANVHDILGYSNSVHRTAYPLALKIWFSFGLLTELFEEDFPCGSVAHYILWNNDEGLCVDNFENVDEGFAIILSAQWQHLWEEGFLLPEPSDYDFRYVNDKLVGSAREEVVLPLIAVKDEGAHLSTETLVTDRVVRSLSQFIEPDIDVVFDPDVAGDSRQRKSAVTHIVLHFTGSSNAAGAIRTLKNTNDLSTHYVVDTDGTITQMVSEERVAYHAGGCGVPNRVCAITGMNEVSIGIEIANLGWVRPGVTGNSPTHCSSVPEGYAVAPRRCDYDSYNNYPVQKADGSTYDGKAACEGENRNPDGSQKSICWQVYPEEQLAAVERLVADISFRHGIGPDGIIGHDEIKATKSDPGPLLPMDRMRAAAGGTVSEPGLVQDAAPQESCVRVIETPEAEKAKVTLDNLKDETYQGKSLREWLTDIAAENNLDETFFLALITQESCGFSDAVSATGAVGLGQFVDLTAGDYKQHFSSIDPSCSCTLSGSPVCGICRLSQHSSSCNQDIEERLNPVASLRASAEHLKMILNMFDEYEDKFYLAAAGYNFGHNGVKSRLDSCEDKTWACVKPKLSTEAQKHGEAVVEFMVGYGGDVEGVGSMNCDGAALKGIGDIRFFPHVSMQAENIDVYLNSLVTWAKGTLEFSDNVNNELRSYIRNTVGIPPDQQRQGLGVSVEDCERWLEEHPDRSGSRATRRICERIVSTGQGISGTIESDRINGWSVEPGFCEFKGFGVRDSELELVLESLRRISECSVNGQVNCRCPVLPEKTFVEDGDYFLVFEDSFARLYDEGLFSDKVVAESPWSGYDGLKVVFEVDDGVISIEEQFWGEFEGGLAVTPEGVGGITDMDFCLPTQEYFPMCAYDTFLDHPDDEASFPVKFALFLEDTVAPSRALGIRAIGSGDSFVVSFRASVQDLSGFVVSCREVGTVNVTTKRLQRSAFSSETPFTLDMSWCVAASSGEYGVYDVSILPVDLGGNSPEGSPVTCVDRVVFASDDSLIVGLSSLLGVPTDYVNGCQSVSPS